MICDICGKIGAHNYRCPNYIPPKTTCYCSFCGEGIYDGEEYIENDNGDYCHYDCFHEIRDLLEWLGYEIKTMDANYIY